MRLLGVGVSNLGEPPPQQLSLDLTDPADEGVGPWGRAAGAVDRIRARYGEAAVGPAALLDPADPGGSGGLRTVRRGAAPWGPASSGEAPPGR